MEMQSESFDAVAYEVEAHLRELRRLVGETLFLSDAQNDALNALKESLRTAELQSSALRQSLLTGAEPVSAEALKEERDESLKSQTELAALEARLRINLENVPLNPRRILSEFPDDELEGGAATPAVPKKPIPVVAGGSVRTFEEADEPPRNP